LDQLLQSTLARTHPSFGVTAAAEGMTFEV
jgi:hypothetical protein